MICPYCANDKTQVKATVKGLKNIRFRYCQNCKKYFCTTEVVSKINGDKWLSDYAKIKS